MKRCCSSLLAGWLVVTADVAQGASAQRDLLLALADPLSGRARISADFDEDREVGDGKDTLRFFQLRPIVSLPLSSRWRLVSDTVYSSSSILEETLSLSPLRAHASGVRWAAGAAVRYEESGKLGAGPSLTFTQEDGNEVSGFTVAHRWSASEDHGDLSTIDGFVTWTHDRSALTLRLEASYDERTKDMLVPVGLELRRMFGTSTVGVALDLRARYYVDVPENAGRWGAGVGLTFTPGLGN